MLTTHSILTPPIDAPVPYWEGRYRATLIDSDPYLLICSCYIKLNPVRANLVHDPADHPWSSYHGNAAGKEDRLLTPHPLYDALGTSPEERQTAYRGLLRVDFAEKTLTALREATNKAWVVGAERFKQEIQALAGRRVAPLPKGRPRCEGQSGNNHSGVGREGNGSIAELLGTKLMETPQATADSRTREQKWETLIRQIAQEDQAALDALYYATSHFVHGLALRIVGNTATAEEVTIDVYTQVWRQAAVYDPRRGRPSAWLLMLTRSRAIDRLRAEAQERRQEDPLEVAAAVPAASPNPEEASVIAERRQLVRAALAALGPEQREAIELAYFSGLSHGEIAARLGQPLGTVKTRIWLGMMKLREPLRPLME
ncbi:MAG: sigma-70 family RNA polymerase sigma factor [Methyloceanibacter sp.]